MNAYLFQKLFCKHPSLDHLNHVVFTLKNDGSEDNIMYCFKSELPCLEGASLLKGEVGILNVDIVNCNSFDIAGSDVDEANTETNISNDI